MDKVPQGGSNPQPNLPNTKKIRKSFRVKDLLDKDLQLRRPITVKLSGCDLQGTGMKLLGPEVEM